MPPDPSFDDLRARLRAGDDAAAREVFNRFAGRLIALASTHLESRLRQKVDPEDVAQSALKSFFRRQANDEFELENWDSLWALLSQITLRKCWRQAEHFRRACRDARREAAVPEDDRAAGWEALARDPTPSEAAMLAEMVEQLMRSLIERERQILQLRLQGYKVPEISAQVGRTEHTIEGVLRRIHKRLKRQLDEDEEES